MASNASPRRRRLITRSLPVGILACLLLLAACGGTSSSASGGAATIAMGASSFSGNTSVTIKAGQSVTFTSDGTHILVIGSHGNFAAQDGAPSELNNSTGLNFSPGDSKAITFPTAGTFQITCMIHTSMQATVTVTA